MITWGMVGNSHDASLAVFRDKKLLWASLAKDFSGIMHDPHPHRSQIDHAYNNYGAPDLVYWYEKPLLKTVRQALAGQGLLLKENNIKKYFLEHTGFQAPIKYTQHHLSHAAYAYYTQPHDDCAVICLDSIGEFETLTVWHGKNNKLKKLHSQRYPHSLGLFYSAMTQRLGLVPQRDEYLVGQMAQKGNPLRFWSLLCEEIIDVDQDSTNPHIRMRENLHRGCMWWRPEIESPEDLNDLAAATQGIFEWCIKILSNWAYYKTGSKHLALAGGGALNRQAVDKIRDNWHSLWVPTNPGDPGSCIGTVLAHTKEKIVLDKQWYKAVQ